MGLHGSGNNSPIANFGGHRQSANNDDTIAKEMGFPWEQYPYRAPYNSSSDSLLIKNRPRRERFL